MFSVRNALLLLLLAPAFCRLVSAGEKDLSVVIDPASTPEVIAKGYGFTEGPLWLPAKGLLFSDIPANTIYLWNEKSGVRVYRKPSGYTNGNMLDRNGDLLCAQHNRKLTRVHEDGTVEVLAKSYNGKKLNSPNDIAIGPDGSIYFTDPTYGITGSGPKQAPEEQPVRGIYRIKDGALTLLSGALKMPNGLDFSADGKTLYVANSADGNLYAFAVQADGTLAEPKLFAKQNVPKGKRPNADGMVVDQDGRVWATCASGFAVYTPQGELLGEVALPKHTSNLTFGGPDGKTLFITATDKVYRLPVRVKGKAG